MSIPFDVGVIGGGIAGTAAALAAVAAGARVVLVGAAPGATALAGGGWVKEPPAQVRDALARAGHTLVPTTAPLPHPVGDLRQAGCAHEMHPPARVAVGACVVGIAGLPAFRPRALAGMWGEAAGVSLAHASVFLDGTPAAGWAPASLAMLLEHDSAPLAAALAALGARTGATRLILPAVLGADGAPRVRALLEHAAGVPVGEALGTPPSLPGWRLLRALERALADAGVAVLHGRAAQPDRTAGRLAAVTVTAAAESHPAAPRRIEATAWVLATGRFVGGGIVADPDWREPALGIPITLTHLGAAFHAVEPLATSSPDRRAAQPPLYAGVAADATGRPLDPRTGQAPFANVIAAGAVLAAPLAECCLGSAAHDGWRAGSAAARHAGAPA
jgi:glycerol-3-phosphate dehydrogenase subunit B